MVAKTTTLHYLTGQGHGHSGMDAGLHWAVLVGFFILGIVGALARPFAAFVFAIGVSISLPTNMLLFARLPALGPYFNGLDACMLICLLAVIVEWWNTVLAGRRPTLAVPWVACAILAVLVMGLTISVWQFGFDYEVLRSFRWAVQLPFLIVIGANLVKTPARAKALLWVLLVGGIVSQIQFLLFVARGVRDNDVTAVRILQFVFSASSIWLVAGPFVTVDGRMPRPWLQLGVGALFAGAVVALQTRSLVLGIAGGMALYYLLFIVGRHAHPIVRLAPYYGLAIFCAGLIAVLGIGETATSLFHRFYTTVADFGVVDVSTHRFDAGALELMAWVESPIVGNGLEFFVRYDFEQKGLNHLGYLTYLSQLGIVGFVVYAVAFPIAVLRRARRLFRHPGRSSAVMHVAALTGAMVLMNTVQYLFSASYLNLAVVPGVLVGAVWALDRANTDSADFQSPSGTA